MHAAVRAAGNLRAVLAQRTFENIRPAHAFEIQPRAKKLKPPAQWMAGWRLDESKFPC